MSYEEEDTCMSYEEEDTCMSYEEEDTCMSYQEEDTCMSYGEEDTCMSYEEEDTHLARRCAGARRGYVPIAGPSRHSQNSVFFLFAEIRKTQCPSISVP